MSKRIRLRLPKVGEKLLDRYLIDEELKGGTYGIVYKARDLHNQEEPIAIKALHPSAASSIQVIKRFEREVQVIRDLHHPNIISITDFGFSPDGCLFYAMELLRGVDLGSRLSRGRLPMRGAALIAVQALLALEHAHNHQIIHRDLKPENIFLQTTPEGRIRIRVLDFGIAKVIGERGENLPKLTMKNEACGTPNYMSPEQVMGDPITAASDLYALGLILFEMLTGEMAVQGKSFVEILRIQATQPITIPGEWANTPMGEVLACSLEKQPQARYQSATDMRNAIEHAVTAM